jgi:hypothetical protein
MPGEALLHERARELLRTGQLPLHNTGRAIFGQRGSGAACAVCDVLITRDQTEGAIEVSHDGAGSGTEIYHFHARCFEAWAVERTKLERASGETGSA